MQNNSEGASSKINVNFYHNLNPWFITGFVDAEVSFMVSILKSSTYRTGWEVQLSFQIKLHKRDLVLLKNIQASLGGIGRISFVASLASRNTPPQFIEEEKSEATKGSF